MGLRLGMGLDVWLGRSIGLGIGMGLDVWLGGSIGLGIGMGLDVGLGIEMGLGLVAGVLFFLRNTPSPEKWKTHRQNHPDSQSICPVHSPSSNPSSLGHISLCMQQQYWIVGNSEQWIPHSAVGNLSANRLPTHYRQSTDTVKVTVDLQILRIFFFFVPDIAKLTYRFKVWWKKQFKESRKGF